MIQESTPRIEGRYKTSADAAYQFQTRLINEDWRHMLSELQPVTSFYISYPDTDNPSVQHWNRGVRARAYTRPPKDITSVNGDLYRFENKGPNGKAILERPLTNVLSHFADDGLNMHLAPFLNGNNGDLRMALSSNRAYLLPGSCYDGDTKVSDYPRVTIDHGYAIAIYGENHQLQEKIPFGWVKVEVKYEQDRQDTASLPLQLLAEMDASPITATDIKKMLESTVNNSNLLELHEV